MDLSSANERADEKAKNVVMKFENNIVKKESPFTRTPTADKYSGVTLQQTCICQVSQSIASWPQAQRIWGLVLEGKNLETRRSTVRRSWAEERIRVGRGGFSLKQHPLYRHLCERHGWLRKKKAINRLCKGKGSRQKSQTLGKKEKTQPK